MTALAIAKRYAVAPRLKDPAQALWTELRFAAEPLDELDLLVAAVGHCEDACPTRGATLKLLETLLRRWVEARLVIALPGKPPRYSLERNCLSMASPPDVPERARPLPFPKRTQQQRLWSAMKILRNFDMPTLLMTATANRRAALDMVRALERGGWLRATASGWTTLASRKWAAAAPLIRRERTSAGMVTRITDRASNLVVDIPARSYAARDRRQDSSANSFVDGGVS